MRRILRNNSGQIILALAIVMSIVILSVAFSIYQMNASRQLLKYEPFKEIILAVTSDIERALAVALRNASLEFEKTYEENAVSAENIANEKGGAVLQKWMRSVVAAQSHIGVEMKITGRKFRFMGYWNGPVGTSYASVDFSMDLEAYGFRGWIGWSEKTIVLTIFPDTIRKTGNDSAALIFNMLDDGKPVPNLTPRLLKVFVWNEDQSKWVPAESFSMQYLGGGNYSLNFLPTNDEDRLGVKIRAITPKDGIVVSANILGKYEEISPEDWNTLYLGTAEGEPQRNAYLLPKIRLSWTTSQLTYTLHKNHKNRHDSWLLSSPEVPSGTIINMAETYLVNITLQLQANPPPARVYIYLYFWNGTANVSIIDPTYLNILEEKGKDQGKPIKEYRIEAFNLYHGEIRAGNRIFLNITLIEGNELQIWYKDGTSYIELAPPL
jgi:hypothetical protein